MTSDCGAVRKIMTAHNYTHSAAETVKVSLQAGVDSNCGTFTQENAGKALQQQAIDLEDIDRALQNLFDIQMRVGYFDGSACPYADLAQYGPQNVSTTEHIALARRMAAESIVLLKNERNALPLTATDLSQVALIGPNANATRTNFLFFSFFFLLRARNKSDNWFELETLLSNYHGKPNSVPSVLQTFEQNLGSSQVDYAEGCGVTGASASGYQSACETAQMASTVLLVMGLNQLSNANITIV